MSQKGSRWPNDHDAYLVAEYSRRTLTAIAATLGRNYSTVTKHAQQLVRRGTLDPQDRFSERPWTDADLLFAQQKLRAGWVIEEVAAFLGRGQDAVRVALSTRGLGRGNGGPRYPGTLTLKDVGTIMGVDPRRAARGWVTAGLLKAHRHPTRGQGVPFRVYEADFAAFLTDHPEAYEYDRIPRFVRDRPNRWRLLAKKAPSPVAGCVTAKQAASMLGVGVVRVWIRCRRGELPARKITGVAWISGREWWIEKAAVEKLRERAACGRERHDDR